MSTELQTAGTDDFLVSAEARLQELGYKQVKGALFTAVFDKSQELFRALDAFSNFGVAFTILSEPMSVLPLIYLGLGAGGPQGMLITWPVISAMSCFVAASMSEIVSSYPTSGGLYYWSASLSGPKWAPYVSYMTGYFNFLGLTGLCSGTVSLVLSQILFVKLSQDNPPFEAGGMISRVITVVAGAASLLISGYIASFGSKAVNILGKLCFWSNAVGLFVIVISLFITSPTKIPPSQMFTSWSNLTGLPDAWAATISVLLACLTYTGYDSAAHLAEETKNPATQGPKSIMYAMIGTFISGYFALFFILSTIDPSQFIDIYGAGSFGLMIIFLDTVGLNAAVFFNVVLMIIAITNMFGLIVTHSRMAFAFSRDGALPGSNWLHHLNVNQVPIRATIVIVVLDAVILLPSLYSNTMYAAINSFGVIGIYLAYLLPILLRVVRDDKFPRGPFHLGNFGVTVGIVAVLFLTFSSIALVLPTVYTDPNDYVLDDNVTLDNAAYVTAYLQNFNWAPVVVCGVYLVSNAFWVFSARKWFKGPPMDVRTSWEKIQSE
ncbi:hypothetical protein HDU82_007494 [Entophlyctis luteolus]|nr:hypothetical protein HDU82_007494 [Entophlyctis luteolus]